MKKHIDNLKKLVGDSNALDREEDIHPFLEDWRGQIKGSTPLILFQTIAMMFKTLSITVIRMT